MVIIAYSLRIPLPHECSDDVTSLYLLVGALEWILVFIRSFFRCTSLYQQQRYRLRSRFCFLSCAISVDCCHYCFGTTNVPRQVMPVIIRREGDREGAPARAA